MGDAGGGWWLASDGRWYPPEYHPAYRPDPPSSAPPPPTDDDWAPAVETPVGTGGVTPVTPRRRWYTMPVKAWLMTCAALALLLVGAGIGIFVQYSSPPQLASNVTPVSGHPGSWTTTPPPSTTQPNRFTTTTAPAAPGTGLVNPSVEQSVVTKIWDPFAAAFAEDDLSVMQSMTTNAAYLSITGAYNCGCPPWPRAYTSVSFSAPPQSTYPLIFWAELQGTNYDGTPLTKEVLFTEASASAPWLIAYIGAYSDGPPILGTSTNTSQAASSVPTSTASVGNTFAQFFETVDSGGEAIGLPNFAPNDLLNELTSGSQTEYGNTIGAGWTQTTTHTVAATSPSMPIPESQGGGVFACFVMAEQRVVTGTASNPVVQPADYSWFTHLLAPGSYSSVTSESRFEVCFDETPAGLITINTNEGGPFSVTGTPA